MKAGNINMIAKVFDGIYRIPVNLPRNSLRVLNSYFIRGRGDERNLLIDTGFNMDECRSDLRDGLRELNADVSKTDLYLTHMHSDHSGLAADFGAAGAHILMGKTDYSLQQNYRHDKTWRECFPEYVGLGASDEEMEAIMASTPAWKYISPPFRAELLQDGDSLFYGGYQFTCISTPGHTPGHLCLYNAANRLMFLGDHVLFDITPNITCWPGVEDSLGDYLESLRKIAAYDVRIPLPGHRTTRGMSMAARVEQLLAHHEKRLEETHSILVRRPQQTCYETASQMSWKIRAKSWADFPPAQKMFALGEAKSHLDYLVHKGKARCVPGPGGHWLYSAV
ncbi:MBL fold metallo-hydrolase [Caproicibacter sp. BJN0012]|uniref:MBL fold metallo-hydrolase n=1 Tax=Caproicibacter sp. BJN0012 TaxID=3110227 RepID=UPI002E125704